MRAPLINLIGQSFGRLTVLRRAPSVSGNSMWECRCRCGKRATVSSKSLRSGRTSSCGCLRADMLAARVKKVRTQRKSADETIAEVFAADPRVLLKRLGIRV